MDDKYSAGKLMSEYLIPMSELEAEYPHVKFIYMTGHTDIYDDTDNKASNQMIRDYCINNGKILYDFADIESYNPDGVHFEYVTDSCDYYDGPRDGTGPNGKLLGNWATEWQGTHTQDVDWYDCPSAHSAPLNANLKAYAAWWLWARLAGWNPAQADLCPGDPYKTAPGVCGCGTPDRDTDEDGIMDCIDPEIKESFPWELFYPAFMKKR